MKKSRFTDSKIMEALKRAEAGIKVPDLCRDGDQERFVLPLAGQILRHGRFDDGEDESAVGKEPAASEDDRQRTIEGGDRSGVASKKVVRPSRRCEMARRAVQEKRGFHQGSVSGVPSK